MRFLCTMLRLGKFTQSFIPLFSVLIGCLLIGPAIGDDNAKVAKQLEAQPSKTQQPAFKPLLGHWEASDFGGDGEIELPDAWSKAGKPPGNEESGTARMTVGDPLTGIRWNGPVPRDNYELRLKAQRVEGFDFFAAVTFPVGEDQCSLVLGGWGGGVLGISSIDGQDASENQTTQYKQFKNGEWVAIRIRVTPAKIECWLDENSWIDLPREGHSFDIRFELDPSLPLGIANYQCVSEVREVEIRELDDKESGGQQIDGQESSDNE